MYNLTILVLTFVTISGIKAQTNTNIEFREYDLKNGLHVILHKDNTNPIVSVDIWYHVGAKDEDSNRTGFAHLFEHMMFQGSANVGKTQHFTYIQNAGGTLNGTTNQDRTNYFETVPSNQLELVLWLESDRMGTLNVTQENFDNQREVVKEEKRQRYDNVPYGNRWENLFGKSFKGQTYSWLPIGSMHDLNDADLDYAKNFYRRNYAPDNAVIVVSGDIEYDNAYKLVEKYFGGLKAANNTRKEYTPPIYNQGEIVDTIYEKVQLPAMYIAYKVPGVTSEEVHALELLSMVLTDGKSSRLYHKFVYDKKMTKSIGSFVWDNEIGGLFVVSSTGTKNTKLAELEEQVTAEIERLFSEEVSAAELEKAKNNTEAGIINSLQTTMGKADQLAYFWTYFKDTGLVNTFFNVYSKFTPGDLQSAAKKYLTRDNRVVLYYYPEKNGTDNSGKDSQNK
jgi:predicted Zn-dependent peptidase